MKTDARIMIIFGTRPEAIKMAPVVRELMGSPDRFRVALVVTAQHREMLDQVLHHFDLEPHHDLDIMTANQSLTDIMVRGLRGLESIIKVEQPDMVMVHGDTATSLVGAMAAFHHHVPVAHVEAGLRSGDRHLPYPEEMYRRLTAVLADVHFAPTGAARANLLAENVEPERIFVTGNTVIDALLMTVTPDHNYGDPFLRELACRDDLVLVEVHRRENWGQGIEAACRAMKDLIRTRPDVTLLFSVHRNPKVRDVVQAHMGGEERVHLLPPLQYPDWVNIMSRARLVVTDSGGLQEEAPALGVPVLLLRDQTERPEAVEAGTVTMVGTDQKRILGVSGEMLDDPVLRTRVKETPNPFGDGRAAARIKEFLLHRWGWQAGAPGEFR